MLTTAHLILVFWRQARNRSGEALSMYFVMLNLSMSGCLCLPWSGGVLAPCTGCPLASVAGLATASVTSNENLEISNAPRWRFLNWASYDSPQTSGSDNSMNASLDG